MIEFSAPMVDQCLGKDASRRITGAEKQGVVNAPAPHIGWPQAQGLLASTMAEAM
jgi:hypothetical protein